MGYLAAAERAIRAAEELERLPAQRELAGRGHAAAGRSRNGETPVAANGPGATDLDDPLVDRTLSLITAW